MTTLDSIKNRLIDRILAVQNEKFLEAIEKIFVTTQKEEVVKLYPEQMEMLMMSDADIAREMNLVRSTINEHRRRSLELMRKNMEESANEKK